jgi:hypothetical protein
LALPEQLLLSDLLRRRARCQQGLERGSGVAVWMHPPVHRVLGWATRPSMFGSERLVWRLDQLCAVLELEVLVKGEPAATDQDTLLQLPTLIEAELLNRQRQPIGVIADVAIELASGRIRHYLVSRSDPRLPGSSRWRLSPERIVDQQPGRVFTALAGLDDLPLARASVRQELLSRSRRWRDQVQQVGERFEERVEGWLEEPPRDRGEAPWSRGMEPPWADEPEFEPDREPAAEAGPSVEPWDDPEDWHSADVRERERFRDDPDSRPRRHLRDSHPDGDDDPWV